MHSKVRARRKLNVANKNWAEALVDFVDDGGSENNRYERFGASFIGSMFQHTVIFFVLFGSNEPMFSFTLIFGTLIFSLFVSCIYAYIISSGTKGGLIRRFWYGISLPIITYLLATSFILSVFKIQNEFIYIVN